MKVIRKYGHFIIVPIYLVFYLLVFQHVESRSGAQVHILHTRLDDMIPFCEYFIIPYVLWFGYVAAAVIYFGLIGKSRQEYFRLIASLGIGMTLFLAISLVWPNGHALRRIILSMRIFLWIWSGSCIGLIRRRIYSPVFMCLIP